MKTTPYALLAILLLAACGGAQPAPYEEPDTDGVCKIDPAMAPERASKPETQADCFDQGAFEVVQRACNDDRDPAACFEAATCLNVALSTMEPDDPSREPVLASAIEGFAAACDGKIAEGCVLYASMAEEEVLANREHPRREELLSTMCEGYVAACNFGEEFDGCNRCRVAGCTGLPDAKPAPIRETVGP